VQTLAEREGEIVDIREVPIESILVDSYNLRGEIDVENASLVRLAESIRHDGLLHLPGAIDEGDGLYTLVYGHRRYWAIKRYLADILPTVPLRIISKSEADHLKATRFAIAENVFRKQLNPIALAKKLQALRSAGLTNREIADDLGYENAGSVTAVVQLLELEPEAQAALTAGRLSFGYGKALLKLKGNRQQQLQALKQIEKLDKKERSVRTAEKIVNGIKTGRGWYQFSLDLPEAAKLQELPKNRHKLTLVFGNVTELREALTAILDRNIDPTFHYVDPNHEADGQVA
jgi:ParB/RepB/Spo0J family partition protein